MTRPARRIHQMLDRGLTTAVATALEEYPFPKTEAECCHPDCTNRCELKDGQQGPPPRFCSTACRMAYARERSRLSDDHEAYTRLLNEGNPTYRQGKEVRRRLRALQMQLDRYPLAD